MRKTKVYEILILPERCKECGICIEFCPRQVLVAGEDNKAAVQKAEACNGCRMCEYRCPDLAVSLITKGGEL